MKNKREFTNVFLRLLFFKNQYNRKNCITLKNVEKLIQIHIFRGGTNEPK